MTFNGTNKLGIILSSPKTVNSLNFQSGAGAFTFSGNTLNIGAGGITNNSGSLQTFSSQISAGTLAISGSGSQTFTAYSSGTSLTLNGSGHTTFSSASSLSFGTYTVNTTGSVVFSGNINNGDLVVNNGSSTISGAGNNGFSSATVNGGSLVLNQTGGYAINGNLTVNAGSVTFQRDNQVRVGGTTLTLAAGAYLDMNGTSQSFQNLVVTGNAIIDFGGDSDLTITNYGGITIADGATLTVKNWNSAVDSFTIGAGYSPSILPKVIFDGYGGSTWSGGYVTPGAPVPEPSTYGFIALGALCFSAAWRRRRVRA